MDELELATTRLGETFAKKWKEINPARKGSGYMFWDDADRCIYADFFGSYESREKVTISSALIAMSDALSLPYSLRIGFHATEAIARQTMDEWFGAGDPERNDQIVG